MKITRANPNNGPWTPVGPTLTGMTVSYYEEHFYDLMEEYLSKLEQAKYQEYGKNQ